MDNKNRVVVLLNHYVKIYGSIGFADILKQLLKEFVDVGRYPINIKPYTELSEEIHQYFTQNNLYARIDADKFEYRLYLGYWKTPLSMASYATGNDINVMVPDSQWFVAIVPKTPLFGGSIKQKKRPQPVKDIIGPLPAPEEEEDWLTLCLNPMWQIDRMGGRNFLTQINDALVRSRQEGSKAVTRQPTAISSEIVMGFIKDNFFELLSHREYELHFGNLKRRSSQNHLNIYREGEGWWITVTDN